MLTSSKLLDALDLNKESDKVRESYGDGKPYKFQYDGAPTVNDQLLWPAALVEAGVRCVTLSYGRWDSHGKNFDLVRDHGGKLDQGLSALIDDLEARGMLEDVSVVVWGEFGRTPRINKDAGRDHWPQVICALLAGGGMRRARSSARPIVSANTAKDRPVHFPRNLRHAVPQSRHRPVEYLHQRSLRRAATSSGRIADEGTDLNAVSFLIAAGGFCKSIAKPPAAISQNGSSPLDQQSIQMYTIPSNIAGIRRTTPPEEYEPCPPLKTAVPMRTNATKLKCLRTPWPHPSTCVR